MGFDSLKSGIIVKTGDLFAVKASGLLGNLSSILMYPPTDRFHYGIIQRKVKDIDGIEDYEILESIEKGIAVGRLSFYAGQDVKFYRVNCPAYLREKAPIGLTKYGRSKYDYLLILKITVQGVWTIFRNWLAGEGIHPICADDLTWSHDNALVCTEAVDIAYLSVGVSLTGGVCPTPSAFKQAELDGLIEEI